MKRYLIESLKKRHENTMRVWYGQDNSGYVYSLEFAGRYTEEEAKKDEADSHGETKAWLLDDAIKEAKTVCIKNCI